MKFPIPFKNSIIGLIHKKLLTFSTNYIINKAVEKKVIKDIVSTIENNGTIKDCVKIYIESTEKSSDDKIFEIVNNIKIKVNEILTKYDEEAIKIWLMDLLKDVKIPDLDDKPENDIKLNELLLNLIKEISNKS
jgi:hypothetical protein